MPVRTTLDGLLARSGLTAREVAARIGASETHLSLFRSGKVRGVRFSTLAKLCLVLDCQPGELLAYDPDPADLASASDDD
ncbi:helix-turn-helix transcriptional regulator [Thermomonas brevis]|uniref:Helix-turn-helix transcriptional regulator n=1 Tax=Thermomonas brevis TaxID=215691 RepID=A0A7G9QT88_9GAMM|nr:helix-turn-helix transcriptional regulator [Thermomonas brevis]QNN46563.1 helix-turn-helix transcriptional regulator [Thermomonas brevis]